ncbi:hypothetical protein [Streptomyces acidiscabies]|uniref:DUF1876 domain-containing protein n=1 Tax=Streptomyces acidiscabies TaxID=42234 RepID=A0ABU4LXD4_9ACTN|nr:hypothetical protein [Streptomyces acidiscabies]MDX3019890.1 hypothetical protein [Streptomyces acidiscabies]
MNVRLEMLGDNGEWHNVPGVATVELHDEQPERTPIQIYVEHGRVIREGYAAFANAYVTAARPMIEEAVRALEAVGRSLRAARLIDQDGNPVRHPDRPAWQSPYGPARRSNRP